MPPFCEKHQRYHIIDRNRRPSGSFTVCPDCRRGLPPVANTTQSERTDLNPEAKQ